MVKLLVSDFDRTLYVGSCISHRTLLAVRTWMEQGNLFAVATGRDEESIRCKLGNYGLEADYLICNNGARVAAWKGDLLFHDEIDIRTVREIVADLERRYDTTLALTIGKHRIQVGKCGDTVLYPELEICVRPEDCAKIQGGVLQIHKRFEDRTRAAGAADMLMKSYPDVSAMANEWNLDIVRNGVDKAQAIIYLLSETALETDVVVIGDSLNDVGMIRRFKGYTLEHAGEEVRLQAAHVCRDVAACIEQETEYGI